MIAYDLIKGGVSMTGLILPVCNVCGKVHHEGMHGGIYIRGKFICLNCEAKICGLEKQNPFYDEIVKKLKFISKNIV